MITFLTAIFILGILTAGLIFVLKRLVGISKIPFILLGLVLVLHLSMALFIFYTEFYAPVGGSPGDQMSYDRTAISISEDFRQGDFSYASIKAQLARNNVVHLYPVVIGVIYAISLPSLLVGMMFSVWLAVVSVLLLYYLTLELGVSRKGAFLVGLIGSIYPSYLFLGSMLLKDTIVVPLVLLGLFLIIKIIKQFAWRYFLVFYLALAFLVHLRFYIGIVLLFTFMISWPFLMGFNWKQKLLYGIIVLPLLGLVPQAFGSGYYGISSIMDYTDPEKIKMYRELAYTDRELAGVIVDVSASQFQEFEPRGPGATVIVEAGIDNPFSFIRNYFISFSYVLLGPFPWHLKHPNHLFTLLETIPWVVMFFFIIWGSIRSIKQWKLMLPILFFGFGTILVLSLLIDNFGVYMRLRIPAFLAFLALLPLYFQKKKKYET